jgi:hypothetical protein
MNWRKGFFRTWVLFAAFWVAGVGAYAYQEPWKSYQDANHQLLALENLPSVIAEKKEGLATVPLSTKEQLPSWKQAPRLFDPFDLPVKGSKKYTDMLKSELLGTLPLDEQEIFAEARKRGLIPKKASRLQYISHQREHIKSIRENLKFWGGVAIAIPAALLILGTMIAWVFGGFRKEQA